MSDKKTRADPLQVCEDLLEKIKEKTFSCDDVTLAYGSIVLKDTLRRLVTVKEHGVFQSNASNLSWFIYFFHVADYLFCFSLLSSIIFFVTVYTFVWRSSKEGRETHDNRQSVILKMSNFLVVRFNLCVFYLTRQRISVSSFWKRKLEKMINKNFLGSFIYFIGALTIPISTEYVATCIA